MLTCMIGNLMGPYIILLGVMMIELLTHDIGMIAQYAYALKIWVIQRTKVP
jgi:hypothetical protein